MKAVKTVAALSTEAFEKRLNDAMYALEQAGMPVLGVQTSHGLLIKQGTILFEDNLSQEQRDYHYQVEHGQLAIWGRVISDLILFSLALWMAQGVLHSHQVELRTLWMLGLTAAGIALLELLNALLGFSIKGLAGFIMTTVLVDRVLTRLLFTTLPVGLTVLLAAAFVAIFAVGGSPLYRRLRAWGQRVFVNHRR